MANHSMYPYPYQPMPLPQYYGYPGMFPQPMSGMAGVGYAPMPQHSQPMTVHQTSASASAGFEPQASTSGYVVGQSSAFTGSEPQAGTTSGKVPRSSKVRSAKNLTLPHSYSSPPQRSRGRSFSRSSHRRGRHSPSHESSKSPQSNGRDSSSSSRGSLSPSSRRSFVQKTRKRRSFSSSSAHSSGSEEEDLAFDEESELPTLSIHDCLSLVKGIKPDLISSNKSNMRVLSAGERSLSKHKSKDGSLCFVQSALVSDRLSSLQAMIRGEDKTPAKDQPADLPHSALKIGQYLPAPSFFRNHKEGSRGSFLAEGILPSQKLTPSSSDLSSRSNPSHKEFKPLLKEKGLAEMEQAALKGLQSLSITDSVMGIVADCIDDSQPLDAEYSRRPSKQELLQLVHFACKCINHAVDASSRCYLNTVLIKRDSFLQSADKLPQDYDKSALRSLPISSPALIGPQVTLNVEKWEKRQFDRSVRSIVSKADRVERSPRKRARSASDHHPSHGSKRFFSSANRPSFAQQKASRGRSGPKYGKSKPKASAHPQ